MKNSNDTIGNRTRDLPNCSAVPQPTAPPRTPRLLRHATLIFLRIVIHRRKNMTSYRDKLIIPRISSYKNLQCNSTCPD